jgi:hypothetical protein
MRKVESMGLFTWYCHLLARFQIQMKNSLKSHGPGPCSFTAPGRGRVPGGGRAGGGRRKKRWLRGKKVKNKESKSSHSRTERTAISVLDFDLYPKATAF